MMNPKLMLIAFVLGCLVATGLSTVAYKRVIAELKQDYAEANQKAAEAYVKVIHEEQAKHVLLVMKLNELDTRKTGELTDAQAENDRLRDLYTVADVDRKRLRIAVKRATSPGDLHPAACAGSVGDGETLELSEAAGSAVWNLRRALIADQAKVSYLQEYIRTLH